MSSHITAPDPACLPGFVGALLEFFFRQAGCTDTKPARQHKNHTFLTRLVHTYKQQTLYQAASPNKPPTTMSGHAMLTTQHQLLHARLFGAHFVIFLRHAGGSTRKPHTQLLQRCTHTARAPSNPVRPNILSHSTSPGPACWFFLGPFCNFFGRQVACTW